jgi:hypothetical protein
MMGRAAIHWSLANPVVADAGGAMSCNMPGAGGCSVSRASAIVALNRTACEAETTTNASTARRVSAMIAEPSGEVPELSCTNCVMNSESAKSRARSRSWSDSRVTSRVSSWSCRLKFSRSSAAARCSQ